MPDRIYIEDIRGLRYCIPGVSRKLKQYGYTLRDLAKSGIPFKEALAAEDAMIARVVESAKKRQEGK